MAVIFAILFAVAACGGGGGGDDGFIPDSSSGSGSTFFLSLVLLDPEGNPTNTVTSAAPATLQVIVTKNNKNGAAIADVVVSAETDIGEVLPSSGTALTNTDGVASFQIEVGDDDQGAGTITASAASDDGTFTASLPFQIGDSGLRLGYFDTDGDFIENEIGIQPDSTLAFQGRAQLTVAIVDENGKTVNTAQDIRFSSGCLSAGQANLEPASPVTSVNGVVRTTYSATGCSGADQISASLVGASAQAIGDLSIASPEATGLSFESLVPTTILLRGTGGGGSQSSDVTFKVISSNGDPVAGIEVDFSLTTTVGGLSVSPTSAFSASDGTVGATVFAGKVATLVRVIATASAEDGSNRQVSTVSDILTVSTGLPDQNAISLTVEGGFVIEDGFTRDDVTRTLSISLADRFSNPVIDGTVATFSTEYGEIDRSCTTTDGNCSVEWRSRGTKSPGLEETRDAVKTIYSSGYSCPSHNGNRGACPDDLGYTRGGRSTVLVIAVGEESFVDSNGNGIMDQDEQDQFDNLPEAFLDKNEDDAYTPALQNCITSPTTAQCIAGSEEIYNDLNSNGEYDLNDNPAVYNGLSCPPEGDGVWCSRELVNVRADKVLILSAAPEWDIVLARGSTVVDGTTEGVSYKAYIADLYNSRPPAGSIITVDGGGDCQVIGETSFEVADSSQKGAVTIAVQTGGDGEAGTVSITLRPTGDGASYTETFNCESDQPIDPNAP
jgi:hypothetical protein